MEQKQNNEPQQIEQSQAAIAANPMLCVRAGELVGAKDANGNDIFIGCVINHNENLYMIKYSKKQKNIVARKENSASWRDLDWICRVAPYVKIEGTVLFDKEMRKRFDGIIHS